MVPPDGGRADGGLRCCDAPAVHCNTTIQPTTTPAGAGQKCEPSTTRSPVARSRHQINAGLDRDGDKIACEKR
ncbi:MAG: excalibur calcium-binding domain-containing protein [Candidatus Microthrix sp.]|nr:excalibur calcium-binding domain-containing protein [Candidatus Microthrix sp.]